VAIFDYSTLKVTMLTGDSRLASKNISKAQINTQSQYAVVN